MEHCIPDKGTIDALRNGTHTDVFAVLGAHHLQQGSCIRTFQPHAQTAQIILDGEADTIEMAPIKNSGLFIAQISALPDKPYRLRFTTASRTWQGYDPYHFKPVLSDSDNYLLSSGSRQKSYQVLGANHIDHYGIQGVHFAVWAPNASRVSVVGNFNGWDGRLHVMRKHPASGIWEIFIPELPNGEYYKYEIVNAQGHILPLKADPYAFYSQKPPQTSSVVWKKNNYSWGDTKWLQQRGQKQTVSAPISIYEVHLGSWRRDDMNNYLSYRELAHQLAEYINQLGYTHLQILPMAEYPFDGSWGYQPVSLFAPTSRYGNPDEFKYLVDYMHRQGIGVIVDWVPAHFPNDPHGLAKFDGSHLYEHADPRQGFHQDWNTCIYNYGRKEVCNFLIDSACYWLDEYHIDGLRVDAVASMLYLDYSRKAGEWISNKYGGNENLEAIDFIRRFNETVYREFPGIMTIAEESTSWPGVTRTTKENGLGFGYKWNMGWMHDTLRYLNKDPVHRKYHHNDMTFGLMYAFSENFILPLSHDEVVHGKGSLINKMSGDTWQKFANLRAYYAFMWTYPGKKLLFMGNEFGQFSEWNHDVGLDWHLLEQAQHKNLIRLIRDLNGLYTNTPALYEQDSIEQGFKWIDADNSAGSIYAYSRHAQNGESVLIACNFTPVVRTDYRIGVSRAGQYREILNTDSSHYGGSNVGNLSELESQAVPHHGQDYSLSVSLPPLATCVFQYKT